MTILAPTAGPREAKPSARWSEARRRRLFADPALLICGVDEAGRGPLAGPVVAAAVILKRKCRIHGLDDSKRLSATAREALEKKIHDRAVAYCVASASVEEVDTLNIFHATMLAMRRAVEGLSIVPGLALIDGSRCPSLAVRGEAVIGGDALVPSISAASILAKVARDRMLDALHLQYSVYGFDTHVGYGTPGHMRALREHGPCEHHRHSFAPVREACLLFGQPLRTAGVRQSMAPGVTVLHAGGRDAGREAQAAAALDGARVPA